MHSLRGSWAEMTDRLAAWIQDQVAGSNSRGVVLGLSGGIDSAVVAVLCKKAFPDNVLAALMPCYSPGQDLEDAKAVAGKFSIPVVTVPLDGVYDSLLNVIPETVGSPETRRLAESNLKPRLRMCALYFLANRMHYLVAGTSNRSELSIGYTTKWGDGAVDIIPLGNLLKRQVRELAAFLEIPRSIIDKPPSAGLWEGQTDEGEMGFTYAELDSYLQTGEGRPDVIARIQMRVRASEHKRRPIPVPPF
ncbi:MAG: NAD(+) synthase [Dehalococcoidia bacterium]|nr:NAD(+) synthase [Dehalococcoidia bacterium]